MSDGAAVFCCGCGGLPPNATCADWLACAPPTATITASEVFRLTKSIHGGISYVVEEHVITLSGTLQLDPATFRLTGLCDLTYEVTYRTEQTPFGGTIGMQDPPCQSCNGCPECDKGCEGVMIGIMTRCTKRGSIRANVSCGGGGTFGSVSTTVGIIGQQDPGDPTDWSSTTVTHTLSGCWPYDQSFPPSDLPNDCFVPFRPPFIEAGAASTWFGCPNDPAGVDAWNAATAYNSSSSWTQQDDPVVSYMVIDPSLGSPSGNPLNIRCTVGPDPPSSEPTDFPYRQVNCSSTYYQQEMRSATLAI